MTSEATRRVFMSLILQNCEVELTQPFRIADGLDLDDLPAPDREVEYHHEPPTRSHDHSDRPIDERRLCSPCAALDGSVRDGGGTADLRRRATQGGSVASQHSVRIEDCQKRVEVAVAR